MEGALEQILRLPLELRKAVESHVAQVLLGRLQEELRASLLGYRGEVVAADQTEVGQHADLPIVGEVVRAVHELLQGAARPVRALVTGRQLFGRGCSSVAHVQGGLPRGAALDVPPFAEVSGNRVPQQSDVVEFSKREELC